MENTIRVRRNVVFRDDLVQVADLNNVKFSFPPEKTFEITFLSGFSMVGTLRDIATLDPEEDYQLNYGPEFSRENLSHAQLVALAQRNLTRHLQTYTDYEYPALYEEKRQLEIDAFDPYTVLGDENMSDADWDEYFSRNEAEETLWDEYRDRSYDFDNMFYERLKEGLQSFLDVLPSLVPEDRSITDPFRLDTGAFRDLVEESLPLLSMARRSIAPSAIDFLQRIMEDIYFGTVLHPFQVYAPSIGAPVRCIVLMGNVHGTTMSCFEVCSQDDDDDGGGGGDSDSDNDEDYSDMDESNDGEL